LIRGENRQSDQLLTLELENERLQRQLLLIQEQNLQHTQRRKGEREGRRVREPPGDPRGRARCTTSQAVTGPVPPLDVGYRNQLHYNMRALHTEWAPLPDPVKEKIDKDLQNKYGYNRVIRRRKTVERSYTGVDGFRSFLPEQHKDDDLNGGDKQRNDKDAPYFKIHMTGKKLKSIEEDLREDYARTSLPNIRSDDTNFRIYKRSKSETPVKPYDVRTKFEDEFFLDTSRSDGNLYAVQKNIRPKLLIEAGVEQQRDW